MKPEEILSTYAFVEKEDLQVWPARLLDGLEQNNVDRIMAYLSEGPISGEELFVLDLPAFLYPVDRFRTLWEALVKEQGKRLVDDIREEELTPSDEFPRLEKRSGSRRR